MSDPDSDSLIHEKRKAIAAPFAVNPKYTININITVTLHNSTCKQQFILESGNRIEIQNPLTQSEEYVIVAETLLGKFSLPGDKPLLWRTNKAVLDEQRLLVY